MTLSHPFDLAVRPVQDQAARTARRLAALLATSAIFGAANPVLAEDFIVDGVVNLQNGGNLLDGDDSLTITGSGAISTIGVDAVSGTDGIRIVNDGLVTADGIGADGVNLFTGTNAVVNTGTIETLGGSASTIVVVGPDSTIENHGVLTTFAAGSEGVFLSGEGASLLNAEGGRITTLADQATAIFTSGNLSILNAGQIRTFGAFSGGIFHDGGAVRITNDGTIQTDGIEASGIAMLADGVDVVNAGSIVTNGTDAAAIAAIGAEATLTNSGTILTNGAGSADGIQLDGTGTITNAGRITTLGPDSWSILAEGGTAQVENSGLIAAGGQGGILSRENDSVVLNSGSIVITSANGAGILAQGTGAQVTNTGVIRSTVPGGVGIFSSENFSTVRNAGQIFMEGGTAIELDQAFQTMILDAGSIVVGDLVVANGLGSTGDIRLPNAVLSFTGLPEFFDTNGRPSLLDGNTLHVFDPAHFAALDRATAGALDGVDIALSQRPRGDGYNGWASGYATAGGEDASAGAIVGGTWPLSADRRIDVFIGTLGSTHDGEISGAEIDTRGFLAGVAYEAEVGRLSFRTTAFVGRADHDSLRRVADNTVASGISDAQSAFSSAILGLSATVGTETAWRDTTLRPSLRLRYLLQDTDAFTESGSNSNMAVGARRSERVDLRAMLEMDLGPGQTALGPLDLTLFGGIDVARQSGDDVLAEVVGQPVAFAVDGGGTEVGGFIGARADVTMAQGGLLSLYGEIGGGSQDHVSGRLGASFVFRF